MTPSEQFQRDLAPLSIRIANLVVLLTPFAGLVAAIALLWGWGFSFLHLFLLLGMYVITALGITVGYHRLFTHKSFETYRPIKWLLAIQGAMAVEGPLLKWVAQHRLHHQHSDHPEDPHSPHLHGEGFVGMLKGLWHAHAGWIFEADDPNVGRYVVDLQADRGLRVVSRTWMVWAAIGLAVPAILGGVISGTWSGALLGFIWGGLVRVFLVHHVTWSVNSVCHLWGSRPFQSHDESRNNVVFGILALGEGWHNAHHAFPTSARHGLAWWQVDISYYVIRIMELLRLAWNVRIPSAERLAAKRTTLA
jgi:stearoyl-CoA desaturase (delta-9 desaturase)